MALIAVVGLGAVGACAASGGNASGAGDDAAAATTIGRSLGVAQVPSAPPTSAAAESGRPRAIGVTSATTPNDADPNDADPTDGDPTDDGDDGTEDATRRLADLAVGDCVDLPGLADPTLVAAVTATLRTCDEPHDAEVYARVSLDDATDAPYPGDDQVIARSDAACLDRFEPYVGLRYVDARLEIVHLRPPRAAWVRGDRMVVCAVINAIPGPLVGTVARAEG